MHKEIGKIKSVLLGAGGYQEAMFGFSFFLGGDGWATGDFWGHWNSPPSEGAQWTEAQRLAQYGYYMLRVAELLKVAKVDFFAELAGKPIEATFDSPNGQLVSWRILTEVL